MQKVSLILLRVAVGCLFFYAGITKILNPQWSAAGYLNNAQTFPELFKWFTNPDILPFINILNEWGLTLIGVALILGAFTKWASWGGLMLMILYYFPVLTFPYAGDHSYIVDEHIIYALVFLVLIAFRAGRYWGVDGMLNR